MIYVYFTPNKHFVVNEGNTTIFSMKKSSDNIFIEENKISNRFHIFKKNEKEEDIIIFSAPLDKVIYTNQFSRQFEENYKND